MNPLLVPFQFEFFRNGLLAAVLVGGLCGVMGVYITLRGMSYIGHGLSHAVLGGAVVSFLLQFNFYLGAGLWGFAAALLINHTARRYKINADAAIGIITTASFALGVALISRVRKFTRSFEAALFGNVLGVAREDVLVIAGVALLVGLLLFFMYKQLLFTTFDSEVARAYGVPVEWVDTLFALALAATIIAATQVVGITLIAAAIVIPPIIARLVTDSFNRMILLAGALGAATATAGMYLSYYIDVSSGATIVLVQTLAFLIALAAANWRKRRVVLPSYE
jgi:ABC-type Mn2+/Zn2+ transport system permease subunit